MEAQSENMEASKATPLKVWRISQDGERKWKRGFWLPPNSRCQLLYIHYTAQLDGESQAQMSWIQLDFHVHTRTRKTTCEEAINGTIA
nr:hypothetical protein HmN_000734700 [Hymenolepis microstoma]